MAPPENEKPRRLSDLRGDKENTNSNTIKSNGPHRINQPPKAIDESLFPLFDHFEIVIHQYHLVAVDVTFNG